VDVSGRMDAALYYTIWVEFRLRARYSSTVRHRYLRVHYLYIWQIRVCRVSYVMYDTAVCKLTHSFIPP